MTTLAPLPSDEILAPAQTIRISDLVVAESGAFGNRLDCAMRHAKDRSPQGSVRDVVERLRRSEPPRRQQAIRLLGAFEADRDDVSIRHDEYLAGLVPDAE